MFPSLQALIALEFVINTALQLPLYRRWISCEVGNTGIVDVRMVLDLLKLPMVSLAPHDVTQTKALHIYYVKALKEQHRAGSDFINRGLGIEIDLFGEPGFRHGFQKLNIQLPRVQEVTNVNGKKTFTLGGGAEDPERNFFEALCTHVSSTLKPADFDNSAMEYQGNP